MIDVSSLTTTDIGKVFSYRDDESGTQWCQALVGWETDKWGRVVLTCAFANGHAYPNRDLDIASCTFTGQLAVCIDGKWRFHEGDNTDK